MFIPEVECPHCHSTRTETVNVAGNDTGEFLCLECANVFPLLDGIASDENVPVAEIEAAQERFDQQMQEERYESLFFELDNQVLSTKVTA